MASITIRNLDDDVKTRLRVRAAENGRSIRALRVTHRDPKWSVMKPNPEIRSRVFVVDTDAATPRERRDLLDQLIREHLKFEELFPTTVKISVPQNGKAEELASSPWKKSGRGSGPFRRLGDERLSRREPPAAN